MGKRIYTIGHSNRPLSSFLACLQEVGMEAVFDVRRFPSSRKFPQYNRDALADSLAQAGIEYFWLEALGGRRYGKPDSDSPNRGLRSPGFRNYADYMLTLPFRAALQGVIDAAAERVIAIMCAEKLYFRCHRLLISDALVARGVEVVHLIDPGRWLPHRFSPAAEVRADGSVLYPPTGQLFPEG